MTKLTPTNARLSLNALHPGNTLRLSQCSAGVIAAIAALALSASFASMNASAQNSNAVAPARAGSDSAATPTPSLEGSTSAVSGTSPAKLSPADQQFVQDASTAGATEIAASKLALTNSADAQVKSFAQRMIADHSRLARNLDIVAKRQGITAAPSADASVTGSLESLHGADFDKAYIAQVAVDGHRKAVAVFSTESKDGNNAQLKNVAARALPIIKHHYAMAQQLAKLKGVTS
jgi:putative membrane protein